MPAHAVPPIDFSSLSVMGIPHEYSCCVWCCDEGRQPVHVHTCAVKLRPIYCNGNKFWRCPNKACFARQRQYWVVVGNEVLFIPTPIQTVLFEAVAPLDANGDVQPSPYLNVLFGGSRQSSKSYGLRWLAHWLCLKFPNFQVLMFRRTFNELEDSQLKNIRREQQSLKAELSSKLVLTYSTTGSQMTFRHCAEMGDETKYLSSAYDLIIFDEETTFEVTQILDISTSARRSEKTPPGWRPLSVGGTNPGGISGSYCRALYVYKVVDPDVYLDYKPEEYFYIQSILEDNPYADHRDYDRVLRKLGPVKYKAWRMADWDATEDQFFAWRKADIVDEETRILLKAHAVQKDEEPAIVTYSGARPSLAPNPTWQSKHEPRRDVEAIDRFCSLHWGLKETGVCHWWACLSDGTFFVEDEYKFSDKLARYVAEEIKQRNIRRNITVRHIVAPHKIMWNTRGETGESLVETFRKAGLHMVASKHDPVMGWNRVHALLDTDENNDGVPWLRFSQQRCPYACLTIPALIGNPTNPEDLAPKQDNKAALSIRYGAMSRPYPTSAGHDIPREALKGKAGGWRYELDEPGGAGGEYVRR